MAQGEGPSGRYDVAIMGGGLAGLTLALQLKRMRADVDVVVLDKRKGPAPEAAFKVGESTVELSGHYFGQVLGLLDHLQAEQNPKMGLRYFYPSNGNEDIAQRVEFGRTEWAAVPSYQLDRGRFENELWSRCRDHGVHVFDGARVQAVDLADDGDHSVTVTRDEEEHRVQARWVIDAAGRAAILKRKLGLARECAHKINSSWFRLDGGLDLEQWSDDPDWLRWMPERGLRRFSTNHLMGKGYWVWLIPLHSGPISIGICADPRFHPWEEINTEDAALAWLREHEPPLGEEMTRRRDQVLDFLKIEDFAMDCERMFSPQRWCLTGEAGAFADPLYSPGSSYIAIANTFICDLIDKDMDGTLTDDRVEALNGSFLVQFRGLLNNYLDQYESFGDPRVGVAKQLFDYAALGALSTLLFFTDKQRDMEFLGTIGTDYGRVIRLALRMGQLFKEWREVESRPPAPALVTVTRMPVVERYLDELRASHTDDELRAIITQRADDAEALTVAIFWEALGSVSQSSIDEDTVINPYAIGLDPQRWDEDGLLDGSGMSVREARARFPGVEQIALPVRTAA